MGPMRLPRGLTQQPQQGAPLDIRNPLTVGLVGAFNAGARNARPLANATLTRKRSGFGFSTTGASDSWVASDTALASTSPTWTILVILDGYTPVVNQGGIALYAERPNDTQIVKVALTGRGGVNTAQLVVRDQQGSLVLFDGNADVRSDNNGPRVIVGVRRNVNEHLLFVNGLRDAVFTNTGAGGTFGPTNATIANDPFDVNGYLGGAGVPLVLVWKRALSDAEIAAVSANPWQVYAGRTMVDTARLTALTLAGSPVASSSVAGAAAWLEQNDTASISAAAKATGTVALSEAPDTLSMAASAVASLSGAWAEPGDTIAIAASARVTGMVALAEQADSVALAGVVGSAVVVNATWLEQSDTAFVAAQAKVTAISAWAEQADSAALAGAVGNAVVATGSLTDASDTLSMLATVRVSAAAGWAEASDLTGFSAAVLVRAGLAWVESPDAFSVAATVTAPSGAALDISKIPASRVAVFDGSGSRIAIFGGSGPRMRFDTMSAKLPTMVGDKMTTNRDPDEESYYAADITQELLDRNTTLATGPDPIELVLSGVAQLEPYSVQTAMVDGVQRTYIVVLLGGVDDSLPTDWFWAARVKCANRERFDKTTWFNRVDT